MNGELDTYEVEFDMRRADIFMQQLNLASASKSVVTPGLCVNTTDKRKTTDRRRNSCFQTSLLARHTLWFWTLLTVQKKHPVSCRRSSRSLWISRPPGHSLADFAECPRTRASTRCVIGQISQRGMRDSSSQPSHSGPQNPRRNQQEPRQQFPHHKENPARALQAF